MLPTLRPLPCFCYVLGVGACGWRCLKEPLGNMLTQLLQSALVIQEVRYLRSYILLKTKICACSMDYAEQSGTGESG